MNVMNYATREVLTIRPGDSVDTAISLMEEHRVKHLVVVRENRPVGMLSDRDVLLSTGWMLAAERVSETPDGTAVVGPTRVDQIMSHPSVRLSDTATAVEAARAFVMGKLGALPIVADDELVGIVTQSDLLRWMPHLAPADHGIAELLDTEAQHQMRARVTTARPATLIGEIIDIFRRYRIRHLPIESDGRLVGIVSDRDVRRSLGWSVVRESQADDQGRMLETPRSAGEIMRTRLWTARPTDTCRQVIDTMLDHDVHACPIVRDGDLLGIVTESDFVRLIARDELM